MDELNHLINLILYLNRHLRFYTRRMYVTSVLILIFKEHERANTTLLQLTLRVVYSIHSE